MTNNEAESSSEEAAAAAANDSARVASPLKSQRQAQVAQTIARIRK